LIDRGVVLDGNGQWFSAEPHSMVDKKEYEKGLK